MKSQKGFTLVELLAVIAILAILVLIAIPNVLNLYRNARKNTFVSDVQNIMRASEQEYVMDEIGDKNNTCYDSKTNPLEIESRSNLNYRVNLNKGKIINIEVLDNNYYINVSNEEGIKRDSIESNKVKTRDNTQTLLDCEGNVIVEGLSYGLPLIIFEGSTPDRGYIKEGKLYKEDIKTEIEKLESLPNKEGYIFKGYNIPESETQIIDEEGNIIKENLSQIKESITLESKWEERPKYVDSELNGADPVLGQGMIPVMLSDTGVATYAHDYDEWYSYKDKKWANAVILVDSPSKEYKAGEVISESDIRGYFVWIPKYKYKLFNMGDYNGLESSQPASQVQEIDIVFGLTDTTENDGVECETPMTSGDSGQCKIGEYMTHPAFLSIPSNGFWVGKFETGYNQNSDVTLPITDTSKWTIVNAQVNEEKPQNIIIKPNVYSWRYSTVNNFFMSAYNFNRSLDSHMMKNTEWGAVAYLSYSKYGIMDEVRINNNSNCLTGYAASEPSGAGSIDPTKTFEWNSSTGHLASTTGNISGVYDMSGGSFENMASYMDILNLTTSEMTLIVNDTTYNKYLDKYSKLIVSSSSYNKRILGDATGELGPFWNNETYNQSIYFADFSNFVYSDFPWFTRGGWLNDTTKSGQFYFSGNKGAISTAGGVRLILTPTN